MFLCRLLLLSLLFALVAARGHRHDEHTDDCDDPRSVVTEFTVKCFGKDKQFAGSSNEEIKNNNAAFCHRLHLLVEEYVKKHGPFPYIETTYETRRVNEQQYASTKRPDTEQATPQPATDRPTMPAGVMPTSSPVGISQTLIPFRLPNCESTFNVTTCARCDAGYVKNYTPYGERTICESRCPLGSLSYTDHLNARACRPRTDTEGCVTSWCIRCNSSFYQLRKNNERFCVIACPSGFAPVHSTMQCRIANRR